MDRITELANELGIDPEAARAALKALKPKASRVLELAREDAAECWRQFAEEDELDGDCDTSSFIDGFCDDDPEVLCALIARQRCIDAVKVWLKKNAIIDRALLAALGDE